MNIHIINIHTADTYMHTYVRSHYGHIVEVFHILESTDTTVQSRVHQRKPTPRPVNVLRWDCFMCWPAYSQSALKQRVGFSVLLDKEVVHWEMQQERQNYSPEFCPP